MCFFICILSLLEQLTFFESNAQRPQTSIYRNTDFNTINLEPKLEPAVYKKTVELVNLISNVYNKNNDVEDDMEDNLYDDSQARSMDYLDRRNRVPSIKDLMKVIQKNYDSEKYLSKLPSNVPRTHYISNPEDLDIFLRYLKKKSFQPTSSTSSDESLNEDEYESDRSLKEILSEARRRALFRIVAQSNETKPNSSEDVLGIKDDRKADYLEDSQVTTSDLKSQYGRNNEEAAPPYEDDTKDLNIKSKEEKLEQEDIWEVITKNYNWKSENTKDTDKNIRNEEDWNQKNKNDWSDGLKEKNNNIEDIGKDWTVKGTGDWEERDKNEKSNKDKHWDDKRTADWNVKKDLDDTSWHNRDKKSNKNRGIRNWDDKYTDKNNVYVTKKEYYKKKNEWDDRGKKKKTENWEDADFDKRIRDEPVLKKKLENQVDRVKTKKETNWDGANERKRERTTRRWKPEPVKINEWAHYNPRIASKAKRQDYNRNVGKFMRTPIPYVGKKGIYDDK